MQDLALALGLLSSVGGVHEQCRFARSFPRSRSTPQQLDICCLEEKNENGSHS